MSESDATGKARLPESGVEASRARREALHTAVEDLERGVAALESEPDLGRFAATMRDVLRTVHQQVDEVEAPDGLLDELPPAPSAVTVKLVAVPAVRPVTAADRAEAPAVMVLPPPVTTQRFTFVDAPAQVTVTARSPVTATVADVAAAGA